MADEPVPTAAPTPSPTPASPAAATPTTTAASSPAATPTAAAAGTLLTPPATAPGTTPEAKVGEAAPAATTEAATPEKTEGAAPAADIDVKLPEGVAPDTALIDEFKPLAKEMGLDSPKAQKLVDLFVKAQGAQAEKMQAAVTQQQEQWVTAVKADKEFGGPALDANVKVAMRAIDKFGSPELKSLLNQSGLGNHPELVRFAYRIGKAFAEDSVAGSSSAPTQRNDEAQLRALYPSMFPKE